MNCVTQCDLGSTVGYAIRFEDCTSKATKIKCELFRALGMSEADSAARQT